MEVEEAPEAPPAAAGPSKVDAERVATLPPLTGCVQRRWGLLARRGTPGAARAARTPLTRAARSRRRQARGRAHAALQQGRLDARGGA
jgi:hypothetical protein